MDLQRPPFPCPLLCIDNFLSEDDACRVFRECIALRKVYMPATIFDGPGSAKVNRSFRSNEVVHLNSVFQSAPERSDILNIMKRTIWTEEYKALWHADYSIFDIINYSTMQEAVISRYGTCDFYRRHQDTRRDHITYRLVTIVYYVNSLPERFTGGALKLWEGDQSITLEPKHNRAIVFPSFVFHEVERVSLQSDRWEDGRFSVNYWLGFR